MCGMSIGRRALPMESARGFQALMATGPGFVGHATRDVLEASQFPDVVKDEHGKIHRPPAWSGHSEGLRDVRAF